MKKAKGRSQSKKRAKGTTKNKTKTKAHPNSRGSLARKRARAASRRTPRRTPKRTVSRPSGKRAAEARPKPVAKQVPAPPAAVPVKSVSLAPLRSIETTIARIATKKTPAAKDKQRRVHATRVARTAVAGYGPHRRLPRPARVQQFNYMKAPGLAAGFDVGDTVEVFCDHERNSERTRGWIKGVVVQVDNKLVAVQFRSNVFLTDGWMVPDRILWYALTSEQIRSSTLSKKGNRTAIPDY